ncbi:SDR family NAD(P)-dependent oxidoreductase [Flagellimonas sp. HSM57]|uniref:SDR family NAD(P)-dependent oxidoreductase n=1 Tax=Flagellimonas sp. HSM57 TaxID=2654675 RepID=UPI0013D7A081|nr:SDR family NAD(P)-dependent oxidoreductase [Flagellimonas sp. HSM57]
MQCIERKNLTNVLPSLIFGKEVVKHKKGVIINISSIPAQSTINRVVGYSTSKAALDNYAKRALELALRFSEGLRRNAIAPCFLMLLFFVKSYGQDYFDVPETAFQTVLNTPVDIIQKGKGHYFVDFGKSFFGTVQIQSKVTQNDSLIFHLGEKLATLHTIDRNPGGSIRYQKTKLTINQPNTPVVLSLPANKKNTSQPAIQLPPSFGVVMPFRYVEIENLEIPIADIEILQKVFHYKFNDEASHFSSSNAILDTIWDLCKHTVKATSFTGFYVDGDRERLPYEADAYINQLSHYCLDNDYSIGKRTNQYFLDNPTWPTEWLLHTVLLFYHDFMYSGDIQTLASNYEALKLRTLLDLEREDGLISSKSKKMDQAFVSKLGFKNPETKIKDIVDWPPGQQDTGWKLKNAAGERDGYDMVPINTVVNSFYYRNLVLMSKIAGHLNKNEEVVFWNTKAEKVKRTINTKLFDKDKGIYIDGEGTNHASLHANMFPLAFGLVSEEYKKTVVAFIKSRGMACSVYGAQYLLDALFNADEASYALALLTAKHDRSWYNMIKIGSTMTLEAWDPAYKPNLDWNHAWGTAPTNIVTRHLWGVTPKTPGFETARIRPQLDDLTFSKIKVPTIKGYILGDYKKEGRQQTFKLILPKEMTAEFILPKHAKKVTINGTLITNNNTGSLSLQSGFNTIIINR